MHMPQQSTSAELDDTGLPLQELLAAARQGARRAFLTKAGGTRYGAAVITATGQIFSAGQYSSFNHSTNIHAEMGALAMAAASGDADVTALLLVSTGDRLGPARPCGVCRQVIAEHARRTGRPIRVIMSNWNGDSREVLDSDELLPSAWSSARPSQASPWCPPDPPGRSSVVSGDLIEWEPGWLGLVRGAAMFGECGWVEPLWSASTGKLPAANDWERHQQALEERNLGTVMPWGDRLVFVDLECAPRVPMRPLTSVGLHRLRPVLDALAAAGVPAGAIAATGSYAADLLRRESDVNLAVSLPEAALCACRSRFDQQAASVDAGMVAHRSDTESLSLADGLRVTVRWHAQDMAPPALDTKALRSAQLRSFDGLSVDAVTSWGTPCCWSASSDHGPIEVQTWHADTRSIQPGQVLRANGIWIEQQRLLVQFSTSRDHVSAHATR